MRHDHRTSLATVLMLYGLLFADISAQGVDVPIPSWNFSADGETYRGLRDRFIASGGVDLIFREPDQDTQPGWDTALLRRAWLTRARLPELAVRLDRLEGVDVGVARENVFPQFSAEEIFRNRSRGPFSDFQEDELTALFAERLLRSFPTAAWRQRIAGEVNAKTSPDSVEGQQNSEVTMWRKSAVFSVASRLDAATAIALVSRLAAGDVEPEVRAKAVEALGSFPDKPIKEPEPVPVVEAPAVEPKFEPIGSPQQHIRRGRPLLPIVTASQRAGVAAALFERYLHDASPNVRAQALRQLPYQSGNRVLLPLLRAVVGSSGDEQLEQQLLVVIAELSKEP